MTEQDKIVLTFIKFKYNKETEYADWQSQIHVLLSEMFFGVPQYKTLMYDISDGSDFRAIFNKVSIDYYITGEFKNDETIRLNLQVFKRDVGLVYLRQIENIEGHIEQLILAIRKEIANYFQDTLLLETVQLKGLPSGMNTTKIYLKANKLANEWTFDSVQKALDLYDQIISKEPYFSNAYHGRYKCLFFLAGRGFIPAKTTYRSISDEVGVIMQGKLKGNKELFLYQALATMFGELEWAKAYELLKEGLKGSMNASEAYQILSLFWYCLKKYDQALDALDYAEEFEPLSESIELMRADILISSGNIKEAHLFLISLFKNNKYSIAILDSLILTSFLKNDGDGMARYGKKLESLLDPSSALTPRLGLWYTFSQQETALQHWREFYLYFNEQNNSNGYIEHTLLNEHAVTKNVQKSKPFFQKAWSERSSIIFLLTDPILEYLRSTKFYQEALEQIKFPELIEERKITILSDTKEQYSLNPDRLLYVKADRNYCTLYSYNNFRVKTKLLRSSFANLTRQLSELPFIQVHRSYLVNLQIQYNLLNKGRDKFLQSPKYDYEIPLSRTFKAFDKLQIK
ncbi:hypothetical protein BKI52_36030 [marine bacterium AO1-C]|nr:hypothetical protein BKI52_36030 [marine bacterium AO1-C]